jgi:hypothetical protein
MMTKWTEQQILNWAAYEAVRKSGAINMFDVRTGCALSGLTKDEYTFCMKNYGALMDAAAAPVK